jgi:hypothetical protein
LTLRVLALGTAVSPAQGTVFRSHIQVSCWLRRHGSATSELSSFTGVDFLQALRTFGQVLDVVYEFVLLFGKFFMVMIMS